MSQKPPSRRGFLRGMLGGSVVGLGLPWLEYFVRGDAYAASFPTRFGVFYWGNGNRPKVGLWEPVDAGQGAEWALSRHLAPLANFKDDINVFSNMSVLLPSLIPHWSGAAGLLTGEVASGDDNDWTVAAPTLDQYLALDARMTGASVYRSMQIGVTDERVFSFTGPHGQVYGDSDPFALYEKLFGPTFRLPGSEPDPSLGYRRSVLDAVKTDLRRLERRVGYADRLRLEAHQDSVRDLETSLRRLENNPFDAPACAKPDQPTGDYSDVAGRPQIEARNKVMAKLLAMSLACDQTRVFHFELSRPLNNMLFPNATDGHHNLTHHEGGNQPEVKDITKFIMGRFADFLTELANIDEGGESLLDHSLVLATSDVSLGLTHSLDNMPVLTAGKACGAIETGWHVRPNDPKTNVNQLILTLLTALPANTPAGWGNAETYTEKVFSQVLS